MKMCLGSMKFQVNDNNTHRSSSLDFLHSHLLEALPAPCPIQAIRTMHYILYIFFQLCMAVLQISEVPFFILLILVKIHKIRQGYFYKFLINETWNMLALIQCLYRCFSVVVPQLFSCPLGEWG